MRRRGRARREEERMNATTNKPTLPIVLRWMVSEDLDAVLRIEEDALRPQWACEDFGECFQSLDTIAKVAEAGDQIIGYLIYRLDQNDRVVVVENIAVAPACQRRGVGRSLIRSLDTKLTQGYDHIVVWAPETCLPLQLLLRDAGFKAVRVHRRWFGDEDAYQMEKGVRREND
jgi:ribosomal protein S18 acetylase RimI-like enzyme